MSIANLENFWGYSSAGFTALFVKQTLGEREYREVKRASVALRVRPGVN